MVQRQFEFIKNIDFIGDIHGYADELEKLLQKLDYKKIKGIYTHPKGRKVVFVGDYVDRGPKIYETLNIVQTMQKNGQALALMGNHEYNLIGFFTQIKRGEYFRNHSINKIYQVLDTLYAFKLKKKELKEYLNWMLSLPLFFENEYFRAVHATWHNFSINTIKQQLSKHSFDNIKNYKDSYNEKSELHRATNILLKGLEFELPNGIEIEYGDFIKRNTIRVKWWSNNFNKRTYRDICVHQSDFIPQVNITDEQDKQLKKYPSTEKPIFFGHYWMQGKVDLLGKNICCLDYSIAREQKLVAYRFNGEQVLDRKNFVWVNCCE